MNIFCVEDPLSLGLSVALIGIVIVLGLLVVLVVLLTLFSKVINMKIKLPFIKPKKDVSTSDLPQDNAQLVAAITVAIMQELTDEQGYVPEFVIKSISQIN